MGGGSFPKIIFVFFWSTHFSKGRSLYKENNNKNNFFFFFFKVEEMSDALFEEILGGFLKKKRLVKL